MGGSERRSAPSPPRVTRRLARTRSRMLAQRRQPPNPQTEHNTDTGWLGQQQQPVHARACTDSTGISKT
eukprot:1831334-Prymnesium_polylepis.1